ncbi:MAG TPA: pH regulation protein F [Thermococcus litoralis]|uniref:pH regulation protein F n=1 Tax=Thermococcus litoralis TaxID=2265 RepID=A0A7C5NZ13_THELI|nr:pH regulation protein F [Thermococcus litoralis]
MIDKVIYVLFAMYGLSGVLYFIRLIKGPSIVDSILAADCVSLDVALIALLLSIYYKNSFLAVGALFLVLWAFILDVFAAKYLTKGEVGT